VQELAPKDPDALAIQFTRFDELDDEQRAAVEAIGKKGHVIVREQRRPVVGHGLLKPTRVAKAVEEQIPFVFNTAHFTTAWKKLGVRPPVGDPHPERTDEKYCLYDERHRDYRYTQAYANQADPRVRDRSRLPQTARDRAAGQGDWQLDKPSAAATVPLAEAGRGAARTAGGPRGGTRRRGRLALTASEDGCSTSPPTVSSRVFLAEETAPYPHTVVAGSPAGRICSLNCRTEIS
jgi:hypothetical protein